MDNYSIVLILIVILSFIVLYFSRNSNKFELPDKEPEAKIVDGVAIGRRTYADLDAGLCVDVIGVDGGLVKFNFTGHKEEESLLMPVRQFLDKFFRTPNGCGETTFINNPKSE